MKTEKHKWLAYFFTFATVTFRWSHGQETNLCGPPAEWTSINTTITNTIPMRTDISLRCWCSIEPRLETVGSAWGISIIPIHVELATTQQANDETLSICPGGGSLCDASTGYLRHSNPDPTTPVTLEGPLIKFTRLTIAYTWKKLSAPQRGTVRIRIVASEDFNIKCKSNLGDTGPATPDQHEQPSTPHTPTGPVGPPEPTAGANRDIPLLHLILAIVVPLCLVFLVAILAVVLCLRRHNKAAKKETSPSQGCCVNGHDYLDTQSNLSSKNNLGVSVYHYNESMASLKPASIISSSQNNGERKRQPPHVDPSKYLPFHSELTQHFHQHSDHMNKADSVGDAEDTGDDKPRLNGTLDQAAVPVEDIYATPYKKNIINDDKEENPSDLYARPKKVKNAKTG